MTSNLTACFAGLPAKRPVHAVQIVLLVLLTLALPAWATDPRELDWPALIPEGAPVIPPQLAPLHDLSQLSDALSAESAPAAHQQAPNAPVVQSLDGQQIKLPGDIVPLAVSEEGRTTEFLLHSRAPAALEPDRAYFQRDGCAHRRPLSTLLDRGKAAGQSLQQRAGRRRIPDGSRENIRL